MNRFSIILMFVIASLGVSAEKHWAFEPIQDYAPPEVAGENLSQIDRFVLAKLKEARLKLSKPVSREKLIRRVTFDLTGLPPTWNDVQEFVNDESEGALEKVVDRLLTSPGYG